MINKKRLVKLTQDLIRIRSENPGGNEGSIARFVDGFFKKIGVKADMIRFARDRDNVLARMKGGTSSDSLLITPHLDTVPAGSGWSFDPFAASVHKGRIYGRGSSDCKGNLAVALEVMRSLKEEHIKLRHDLLFLATADEEAGSKLGLIPILKKRIVRPSYAVILDASDFTIVTAQKGMMHFKVKVSGRKAHGAYPHLGVNAINKAARLIRALEKIRFNISPHKLLGKPTVNVGTIHGGDKVNMVADWCEFEVDLRFLPGMKARELLKYVKAFFDRQRVSCKISVDTIQAPYEIKPDHFLVRDLINAAAKCCVKMNVTGSQGATVLTFFKDLNIPAAAIGFGIAECMHATDEYVKIDDLYYGALMLERFIKDFHPLEDGSSAAARASSRAKKY